MTRYTFLSSAAAFTSALSMAVSPLAAADLPVSASHAAVPVDTAWQSDSENAERHRRYRHHRHRGIDAGDVLAGVLILGGIAAVASAASKPRRDRRYPVEQPRYRDRRGNSGYQSGEGLDRAVDMCLREIERDVRVEAVNTVNRTGEGWDVSGTLYNGDGFTCRIGNDGRVDDVAYGARSARLDNRQAQDRQYSDERYAEARRQADTQTAQARLEPAGPQPAYPGGPLPGEEGYETDEGLGG